MAATCSRGVQGTLYCSRRSRLCIRWLQTIPPRAERRGCGGTNSVTPAYIPTSDGRIVDQETGDREAGYKDGDGQEIMRMTVLASGSKGNSTVIASSRTCVLVDAGLSCRELLKRMAMAGEDPAELDAILITHEHQDHIAGLAVLARRLKIPFFFTEPTHRAWMRMLTPRTTMTYAKWLDHIQREKEARAAAVADTLAHDLVAERASIAHLSAEAAALDSTLNRTRGIYAGADPLGEDLASADPDEEDCDSEVAQTEAQKSDPTQLPAVEHFHDGTNFSTGEIDI